MKLANTQLLNFVQRIKLSADAKSRYRDQINNLVENAKKGIEEHKDLKVRRVLRAGSWRKGTCLRPRDGFQLDVDIVFFVDGDPDQLDGLHDALLEFLLQIYPNKKREDFTGGEKTVGLVFRGTGLEADLVPVVRLDDASSYVWQPSSSGNGKKFVTSVEGQLDFTRSIRSDDPHYTARVRIQKAWRNRQELRLSSFAIELIEAYLLLRSGRPDTIEDGLIRFFDFLGRGSLPAITFPGARGRKQVDGAPAYVADPTNNENNVFAYTSPAEWTEITEAAQEACELLSWAQSKAGKGETVDLWKRVLGPQFSVEDGGEG